MTTCARVRLVPAAPSSCSSGVNFLPCSYLVSLSTAITFPLALPDFELEVPYPRAIASGIKERKAIAVFVEINFVVKAQVLVAMKVALIVRGRNDGDAVMGIFPVSETDFLRAPSRRHGVLGR